MNQRWRRRTAVWTAAMLLGSPVLAQDTLLVTYGAEAPGSEGDDDHVQVIFLRVPEGTAGKLYVRLFDADCGGRHDAVYGAADTSTRFSLYGGSGAASAPSARSPRPSPQDLTAGTLLQSQTYTADPALDDTWLSFAEIAPGDGEPTGDGYVWKLVVEGTSGNDGNRFDVALSTSAERNELPAGAALLSYAPALRFAGRGLVAEMRFDVPTGAEELTVYNFDAAGAATTVETALRSVPVESSGQGTLARSTIVLQAGEAGQPAALTLGEGGENTNDAVFYVTGPAGEALPIALPVRTRKAGPRGIARVELRSLADCLSMLFDGSGSTLGEGVDLAFSWDLGDGGTDQGSHVVHRFAEPGTYQATLRVTAASDPLDRGTARAFPVAVNQVPVAEAGADRVLAPDEEVTFDGSASRDGDGELVRYLWDFDDGTRGEGRTAGHAYPRPGLYTVLLRVEDDSEGPCNFATDRLRVRVNSPPVAEAGGDVVCSVGEAITLDAGRSYDTDGELVGYAWDLGDGNSRDGQRVEQVYERPGRYTVALEVQDDAGARNSTASDRLTVVVNDPPRAEAGEDLRLAVGEVAVFDASGSADSDGEIVYYSWDFGDGREGEGERLPYAYREPGTYTVTLAVRDNSPAASGTAGDRLTVVVNAPPRAAAGDDQVVTASEVAFDASASADPDGGIAEYRWDFGDGTVGSGADPVHVYARPGTYEATLTVIDDSGTPRNAAGDKLTVVVNERPLADAGPDRVAAPGEPVSFSGASSADADGTIAAYQWDFGDGRSAAGATVSHAYGKPGTYTAQLTVRDDTEDAGAVDFDEVLVRVNTAPVARAGGDVVAAPGEEVRFDGGASYDPDGTLAAYRWSFSDGQDGAATVSARRSFAAPGLYTARLAVTDASGASNGRAEDELLVRINHPPVAVPGRDVVACDGAVVLDGSASADADGDALTYVWDLGDGATALGAAISHVYAEGGKYPVTLTVDDGQGLRNSRHSDSLVVQIHRPPVAVAGEEMALCGGDVALFDASASYDPEGGPLRYRWDFGDGTGGEGVNPTKTYLKGGTYTVSLAVEDDSGMPCDSAGDQLSVRVAESPTAEAGADVTVCANTAARFDGTGSRDYDGVVNRYRWDFGDGTRGGGATPEHIYSEPGTYRAQLTVTGDQMGTCDNTDTDELSVRVLAAPAPRISGPGAVPVGQSVTFDGSGSSGEGSEIVAWEWDFGDGGSAAGESVSHTYETAGRHPVSLTLRTLGEEACSTVRIEQLVIVNQSPTAVAGEDRLVGVRALVELDGSGSRDDDGAVTSYKWDLGDGATAAGVEVRHRYQESGSYRVELVVRDDSGLENASATDTLEVTVNAPPVPVIDPRQAACAGVETSLSAPGSSDPDGEIASFQWLFGDGATAAGPEATHTYTRPGLYHVTLVADDGLGVSNSRQQATLALAVNHPPVADAGPDRVVCPGREVAFDGSGSTDRDGELVDFRWAFGGGESAAGRQVRHTFAAPGRVTARLEVTDDSGSSCATADATAAVRVNTPPVAVAGPDRRAKVGGAHDALLFDATASHDADGDALTYVWDLGDGNTRTGAKVYHTYRRSGRYEVRLTVRDGTGTTCGTATDELAVDVEARQP